jgi:hypothetical protein
MRANALAHARALEARRDVVGQARIVAQKSFESSADVVASSKPPRPPLQVGEIQPSLLGAFDDLPRERERVVDDLDVRRRFLSHLSENRPFGARRDDRIRNALDPDPRPTAVAALVPPGAARAHRSCRRARTCRSRGRSCATRRPPYGGPTPAARVVDPRPLRDPSIGAILNRCESCAERRDDVLLVVETETAVNGSASVRALQSSETGSMPSLKP